MCGIAGIVGEVALDTQLMRQALSAMSDALKPRGPDDYGEYLDPYAALAARRLSIIDLAGGHQPISNEDGSVWVILNGEIYNYKDLQKHLRIRGHTIATNSDTEVIVHLYEEYGIDCPRYLKGMFAFAIWDRARGRLLLARDRFGEKPLFYTLYDNIIAFASEMRALLRLPGLQRTVDIDAIAELMVFGYTVAPRTIISGIYKLPPATILVAERGGTPVCQEYWDLPLGPAPAGMTEVEALDTLDRLLRTAVERASVSDVAVGVLLSGGVDSSIVAALLAEGAPAEKPQAFTIAFEEEPEVNEEAYASLVARHLGLPHHIHRLRAEDVQPVVSALGSLLDEPIADPSFVPTYLVSTLARQHVKVALGGDGGDELLGGYPKYCIHSLLSALNRFPPQLVAPLTRWAVALATSAPPLPPKLSRLLRTATYPPAYRNQLWIGPFLPADLPALMTTSPPIALDPMPVRRCIRALDTGADPLNAMMYLDAKLCLPELFLAKIDRASMGCSLEVRSPFLDVELAEYCISLPSQLKIRSFSTKYLLKQYASAFLPKETIFRHKKGFGLPLSKWSRGFLKSIIYEELSYREINRYGIFRYDYVNQIMQMHMSNIRNHSSQIWALLVTQLWLKHHLN